MGEDILPRESTGVPERPLILVVEDEPLMQRETLEMVRSLGYNATLAVDGLQGLKMAREMLPDLIVSDAVMPRMDGREMCRILKTDELTKHIKIIIATSLTILSKQKNQAFRDFFVDGYFNKPLDPEQLRTILQQQLSKTGRR